MTDELKTGWLSPTGEFIPCETYNHISIARNIFKKDIARPDEQLHNLGWVSISIATFLEHGFIINFSTSLTPEQIKFLKPYYYGEYNLELTYGSKLKYEEELYGNE